MIYQFQINRLDGTPLDWNQFKGKKLVLVNVASECGLTPQYEQLQYLAETYSRSNVEIIGFPCNDFAGQEPGTPEQIQNFCSAKYHITFPLTEKIHVVGVDRHPIYSWLLEQSKQEVTWNFQKYLIDENGAFVACYPPQTEPISDEIVKWIKS